MWIFGRGNDWGECGAISKRIRENEQTYAMDRKVNDGDEWYSSPKYLYLDEK